MGDDVKKRMCLNVGSGTDYKPSTDTEAWVNVDPNPATEPTIVCRAEDLDQHFEENSFDEVHLIHVWEHCEDLMKPMEQIWRVLKPGGKLICVTPYFTAQSAFSDPTHKHFITPVTYGFLSYPVYEENARLNTRMSQLFPQCDFDIKKRAIVPAKNDTVFRDEAFAMRHYFDTIEEMQVEMEAVKPIRSFDLKKYQQRGA